jgi:hypothetical protein
MLFVEKIKQLREEKVMPQRKFLCKVSANRTCSSLPNRSQKLCKQFAAALEIDSLMCSKMERDDWRVKSGQIRVITRLLQTNENMLVRLWVADKIIAAIGEEKELAGGCVKNCTTEDNIKN